MDRPAASECVAIGAVMAVRSRRGAIGTRRDRRRCRTPEEYNPLGDAARGAYDVVMANLSDAVRTFIEGGPLAHVVTLNRHGDPDVSMA